MLTWRVCSRKVFVKMTRKASVQMELMREDHLLHTLNLSLSTLSDKNRKQITRKTKASISTCKDRFQQTTCHMERQSTLLTSEWGSSMKCHFKRKWCKRLVSKHPSFSIVMKCTQIFSNYIPTDQFPQTTQQVHSMVWRHTTPTNNSIIHWNKMSNSLANPLASLTVLVKEAQMRWSFVHTIVSSHSSPMVSSKFLQSKTATQMQTIIQTRILRP